MEDHQIHDLRAQVLWSIAECLMQEDRLEEAQKEVKQALHVAVEQKTSSDQGVARRVLGCILNVHGQREKAEALFEQSLQLLLEHGPSYQLGRTYLALAVFYEADRARHGMARQALQQARSIFAKLEASLELRMAEALAARL